MKLFNFYNVILIINRIFLASSGKVPIMNDYI